MTDFSKIRKRRRGLDKEEHPVVGAETLETSLNATLEQFLEAAAAASVESRALEATEDVPRRARPGRRRTPPKSELAQTLSELRAYLGEELTVVSKLSGEQGIEESERQREIAKGALAMLRKPELQRAARALRLSGSGTKDALLDRLVATVGPEPRQIADLIARAERRPSEGRRHAARLFMYEQLPDTDTFAARLREFEKRYVRTDRARWFVLDSVRATDGTLALSGKLRTYEIEVHPEMLDAHPRNFPVELWHHGGEPVLRAYSRYETEGLAAVEALGLFIDDMPLSPFRETKQEWATVADFDAQTAWLLELLLTLIDEPQMTLEDVTSASFEKSRAGIGPVRADIPHVGSARLRGQHVLDSQVACRHLTGGERLSAVTALVRFRTTDDSTFVSLPVRIAVTRSYVAVMTGFGLAGVEESRSLHRRLEDFVVTQLTEAGTGTRLLSIADEISARAVASDPPTTANLFARISRGRVTIEGVERGQGS